MNGRFANLNYESMKIEQTSNTRINNSNYTKNLIHSTQHMHDEGDKIKKRG